MGNSGARKLPLRLALAGLALMAGLWAQGPGAKLGCPFNDHFASMPLALVRAPGPVAIYDCWHNCQAGYPAQAGDFFLVDFQSGAWICGYHQGREGAGPGWIRVAALRWLTPAAHPSLNAWTGAWRHGEGRITLRRGPRGATLAAAGDAVWHGAHTTHSGSFAGEAAPDGNRLQIEDGGCRVDLTLVGGYLVSSDNGRCGGMNVRFNGVWRR